jgi:hypothetical protein
LLSRESMKTFQELADEAFRDLLHKYGRPTDLKAARCGRARDPRLRRVRRHGGGSVDKQRPSWVSATRLQCEVSHVVRIF